jgi:hypothetical protein
LPVWRHQTAKKEKCRGHRGKTEKRRTDWNPEAPVHADVGILSFNVGDIFYKGGDNLDNGG